MNEIHALELISLTKKINKKTIVDGINFKLFPGEVFGLLGPNGAGKTTIIRMLLGLISPTSGEVEIYGKSLTKDFEGTIANVGAIVESPEFYKHLTGYQNLVQYSRMYAKKISRMKIDEVVSFVGLNKAINNRVREYSLGMRQRLGLAQALLHEPRLLILDEPTNGLDPSGIHELRNFLRKIAKDQDITILVSSHILTEMQLLCDRVAIINNGRLAALKTVGHDIDNIEESDIIFKIDSSVNASRLENIFNIIKKEVLCDRIEFNHDKLSIKCPEGKIPIINKILVQNDISVYGIESKAKSLESQYIEIVEGGSTKCGV